MKTIRFPQGTAREWQEELRKRRLARSEVNNEISRGNLPKPETLLCCECGAAAEHYHHYTGYEKENWLDVQPICAKCHHQEERDWGDRVNIDGKDYRMTKPVIALLWLLVDRIGQLTEYEHICQLLDQNKNCAQNTVWRLKRYAPCLEIENIKGKGYILRS